MWQSFLSADTYTQGLAIMYFFNQKKSAFLYLFDQQFQYLNIALPLMVKARKNLCEDIQPIFDSYALMKL